MRNQDLPALICLPNTPHAVLARATAEEAAWEHDLKRLKLVYEDEGDYNFRLQLGQGQEYACFKIVVRHSLEVVILKCSPAAPRRAAWTLVQPGVLSPRAV